MFSIRVVELGVEEQGSLTGNDYFVEVTHSKDLQSLLLEFKDLFVKPLSLPPNRPFDHSIPLKSYLEPVNIRAYRYPPIQKAEIEK